MIITTCIFDAYGTLFDVTAAAREAASEPGNQALAESWPRLAADWRAKQLEYTWLRAITGDHTDFWSVTQDGLDWALEVQGLTDPRPARATVAALLGAFGLPRGSGHADRALKDAGLNTAILSNGSPDMLAGAVNSTGLQALLDDCLSVESVGIFKPADAVYQLVPDRFDCTANEVLFRQLERLGCGRARQASGLPPPGSTAWGFRSTGLITAPPIFSADLTGIPDIAKGSA